DRNGWPCGLSLPPAHPPRRRPRGGTDPMTACSLRVVTLLAPCMLPVYRFIARHLGVRLGVSTHLSVASCYEEAAETADVCFVCGLPYVRLMRRPEPPVELLAAPVLQGERYAGRPIYFSDVIVNRDSRFRTFADLRGCSWSYNEPSSHSGYGVTCFRLVQLRETNGYFG